MKYFLVTLSFLILAAACGPATNKRYRVEKPSYQSSISMGVEAITADQIYFSDEQQVVSQDSKCPIDFKYLEIGYLVQGDSLTLFKPDGERGQQYQRFMSGVGIEGAWYSEEMRTDFDDNDYLYRVELKISSDTFIYTQTCSVI